MPNSRNLLDKGRNVLKATLPPVVVHAVKERQQRYYQTFADASNASAGSWQNETLTRFRVEEAIQNLPDLSSRALPPGYSLLVAVMALLDPKITPKARTCDLGGGCGAWGYRLAQDVSRPFVYEVVEHEGLVTACNAQPFFSWGKWSAELPAEWDVLVCSGTLQCLEKPYDLLRTALQRTKRHALVARTTFSEKDYFQVQTSALRNNGHSPTVPPGYDPAERIYYPHRTVRLSEVLAIANSEGFEVTFEMHTTPSPLAPGAFDQDMVFTRREPV